MTNLFEEMESDQADVSALDSINTEGLQTVAEMARAVTAQEALIIDLRLLAGCVIMVLTTSLRTPFHACLAAAKIPRLSSS